MAFLTPLDLRAYKPDEWVLLSALSYKAEDGARYCVPAGFITDLASIPQVLRGLYHQTGKSRRAAVLHDFLYCIQLSTRAEADALFLEALKSEGVGVLVRWSMWAGVRAGGWVYWNKRAAGEGLDNSDFVPAEYWAESH